MNTAWSCGGTLPRAHKARDQGATHVWASVLYLRPGTREHFLDKLAQVWPELLPVYERLYAGRAYLPKSETDPRRTQVQALARRFDVGHRRVLRIAPAPAPPEPSPTEQLTLILSTDAQDLAARQAA